MEAGLVDVEYGEGWRGGGSFFSTGEDSSVHEQRVTSLCGITMCA